MLFGTNFSAGEDQSAKSDLGSEAPGEILLVLSTNFSERGDHSAKSTLGFEAADNLVQFFSTKPPLVVEAADEEQAPADEEQAPAEVDGEEDKLTLFTSFSLSLSKS